ncbi:DUF2795 domain-containing protein [Mycoplasma tauri]|uniref:DUF2795 domain-containing protein n=1 Tax=Mycoplasma tauri TaxID=547987 RepID=UPI001CBB48BF|nr:DUF2795 domain-containing protein [Mycoplasma tauri]MBZ4218449.1 DUF2795 domain-containing protein [Mycoplasma tauri]
MKNKKLYFGIAGIASTIIPMAVISVSCGKKSAKDELIDYMKKNGAPQAAIDEIIKSNRPDEDYRNLLDFYKNLEEEAKKNNKM